ncbi:MAG: VPLPA-CTERM sorting domain-containing protein [Pseudomonadota bacterium]
MGQSLNNRVRGIAAAAMVAAISAAPAQAVTVNIDDNVSGGIDIVGAGGNVTWQDVKSQDTNNEDYTLGGSPVGTSLLLQDARTPNSSDSYDDGSFAVNGQGIDDDDGDVDVTEGSNGTKLVADPVFAGGLTGAYEWFFFGAETVDSDPLARAYIELTNPTNDVTPVTLQQGVNSGADSNITVERSGTGDSAFDGDDAYALLSDDGNGDPFTGFSFFGDGAQLTPTDSGLFAPNNRVDVDNVNTLFEFDLAPGETISLLFFWGVFDTVLYDLDSAEEIMKRTVGDIQSLREAGYLVGLSDDQIGRIANYGQGSDVAPIPIPATLPLLLGGIGALAVFRRRRGA